MMFIILTLIVAVAAFNLVSTLVMTVTDKRADIAILRTLGASPKSIMGIFVVQGAMVGVIGTFLGLALGLGIAYNIDVIVPAIEHALHTSFLPQDIYLISKMPSDPQQRRHHADRDHFARARLCGDAVSELARQPRESRGGAAL